MKILRRYPFNVYLKLDVTLVTLYSESVKNPQLHFSFDIMHDSQRKRPKALHQMGNLFSLIRKCLFTDKNLLRATYKHFSTFALRT